MSKRLHSYRYLIILLLVLLSNVFTLASAKELKSFQLHTGDLLFQDLDCGTLCDGIGKVTYGVDNTYISHVGIVASTDGPQPTIIEAIGKGVSNTSLSVFLARSLDEQGKPRVLVARLKPSYHYLIPRVIMAAEHSLGVPYNATFYPNHGESEYCSQLVYDSFKVANLNRPFFKLHPMNFISSGSGDIAAAWKKYFAELNVKPPQGLPGTNPGRLSRAKMVEVVHWYGQLRRHQS